MLRETLMSALPAGMALRERADADLPALARLYASTREDELREVAWTGEQKLGFLFDQFDKQHRHYLAHYPAAHWLVITRGDELAGRLYIDDSKNELRLMDIALLAQYRNAGTGGRLVAALLSHADALRLPVTLHVEPTNRAHAWYESLGFEDVETRGYYRFMRRKAAAP